MSQVASNIEQQLLADVPTDLLIGGERKPSRSGGTIAVDDPATEATIAHVADACVEEALEALDAACVAQPSWGRTASRDRADISWAAHAMLLERIEEFALLITLEMGKPLDESRAEVRYAAEFLRWFAEETPRVEGRYSPSPAGESRILTMKQPVGPCLLVTPWNFPLAMGARKVGPAVAAGCTMVVKPARQTPLSMLLFARVLEECGLPPGVLNVVTTSRSSEVVEALLADRRLRKVSFTGSTEVGRVLLEKAAPNVLRSSMELGGNAPFIVFDDADIDVAVDGAMIAKMRNMGQSCTAANRFYVHEHVADEFASRFAQAMTSLRVGRGTEPDVDVGPLIDAQARDSVSSLVEDAVARGAVAMTRDSDKQVPDRGFFYPPTVLDHVSPDARLVSQEIFGPVAAIQRFKDEDEALERANESEHGLVGFIFTRDLARALRASERLESGMVGVNRGLVSNAAAPFGGVKHSGIGREGSHEGIDEYLSLKYVAIPAP